jgi:large subunit ribosomal protein L19
MNAVDRINSQQIKDTLPEFSVGDTVRADLRIVEGGKERIQSFSGTVIAVNGKGISRAVTLRRVSYGQGMERVIPLHSPRLARIEVMRRGKTGRAKLYYLRERKGRAGRVKERETPSGTTA